MNARQAWPAHGPQAGSSATPLLQIDAAVKRYNTPAGPLLALDGVDLQLSAGETVGLVGESGCGKSTLARAAMGLVPLSGGRICFEGRDIAQLDGAGRRTWRSRQQMVFQDPFSSLNPRTRIGRSLEEPLLVHGRGGAAERQAQVLTALARVGLPADAAGRYPHEFSGGQRQRVAIARALMLAPDVLVCDEAVSALDVSVRAQVLNLLMDLRQAHRLAMLFISHDLSVVRHIADRVVVMYLGRVVEDAPSRALWSQPQHPYTRSLMAAVPSLTPPPPGQRTALPALSSELPSPLQRPSACAFHPRCPQAQPRCAHEQPVLRTIASGHRVACHLA